MKAVKIQSVVMDPGVLEIVLGCSACHKPVWVKALDWTDADLRQCRHCHAQWTDDASVESVGRALEAQRQMLASDAPKAFDVRFGGKRVIRDVAA